MAGNLQATVDYLVAQVAATVGHARVYNRHRSTRSRAQYETLFVGAAGLDYWTVRRESSSEVHRGASHQATRTHRIRLEGTMAAQDDAVALDSPEVQLQLLVEDLDELLRNDPSLGGNVEHAVGVGSGVEDVQVAAVACNRGYVIVEAREALSW